MTVKPKRVVIMGAGGRDFHNFNVYFRDNSEYEVVAFTASQIPNIAGRLYPPELAGKLYPNGIPILPEEELPRIIREYDIDEVVLAYSDLTFNDVGHKLSLVLSLGANFKLLGLKSTMLESSKPVISVCAVRTGAGKSTVSRRVAKILRDLGLNVVIVRHPMAYGDLRKQVVQRFASLEDLDKYECTIEEREEYEQHIENGFIVYAGVDYEKVLREVEKEADIILWDGGNNDLPFFKPNLHIVVADPMRPGQEVGSYPGEVNVRLADVVVINKVSSTSLENVKKVEENVKKVNSKAVIIKADSEVIVDRPDLIKDKRVLVVEDGPSVTHGGLPYGAGYVAAKKYGAREIVNPRAYVKGEIKKAYEIYPHMAEILPTLGYGLKQIKELEEAINSIDADSVILGTQSLIVRYMSINKPIVRVRFELKELSKPDLKGILEGFVDRISKH